MPEESSQRAQSDPPATGPAKAGAGLSVTAFVLALIGLLTSWFPFAGFLGTAGFILGLIALKKDHPKSGLATAGIALGACATLVALAWSIIFVFLASSSSSSCPHVYSFDGQKYTLDADPLSGALFAGGESTDRDRLEHLTWHEGGYKIRIVNDRDEFDFINSVSLLRVEHLANQHVLPTVDRSLVVLDQLVEPVSCVDKRGRDHLAEVTRSEGRAFASRLDDFDPDAIEEPLEILDLLFDRSPGVQDALLLRVRNTQFGAEVFAQYLAEFGPGLGFLLDWAQKDTNYPYRQRLDDEMHRLAIPLVIKVWEKDHWVEAGEFGPIGPAVYRSQVLKLALANSSSPQLRIRLEMSPLYWQIDQVGLARSTAVSPRVISPTKALDKAGHDQVLTLMQADERRVRLDRGESIDLEFSIQPAEGPNTVVMQISGYYEYRIGGHGFLNPLAIYRHEMGSETLPRYVLRKAILARANKVAFQTP
jgi:hypothetical protein